MKAYLKDCIEVGTDEVGRGCLGGNVVSAAVILPKYFDNPLIMDSKKLNEKKLKIAYDIIVNEAIAIGIGVNSPQRIDEINILRASIESMHFALDEIYQHGFEHIIVDGNQFTQYKKIPHTTVIKGDATYYSIAAASIVAKYTRDKMMEELDKEFPGYGWADNVGYATQKHREAIKKLGPTVWHRKSFIGNVLMEMNTRKLF